MDTLQKIEHSTQATITVKTAAEILEIDPRTVTRGIEEGAIPAIKIGRRIVIPRKPFLRMLTGESAEAAA